MHAAHVHMCALGLSSLEPKSQQEAGQSWGLSVQPRGPDTISKLSLPAAKSTACSLCDKISPHFGGSQKQPCHECIVQEIDSVFYLRGEWG